MSDDTNVKKLLMCSKILWFFSKHKNQNSAYTWFWTQWCLCYTPSIHQEKIHFVCQCYTNIQVDYANNTTTTTVKHWKHHTTVHKSLTTNVKHKWQLFYDVIKHGLHSHFQLTLTELYSLTFDNMIHYVIATKAVKANKNKIFNLFKLFINHN